MRETLAAINLTLDTEGVTALKGQKLHEMCLKYKDKGAPNFQNKAIPKLVSEKHKSLKEVVRLFKFKSWTIIELEEEPVVPNNDSFIKNEDEDEDSWENE